MQLRRWATAAVAALAVAVGGTACGGGSSHSDKLTSWGDCAMNVLAAHGVSPTINNIPSRLIGPVTNQCGSGPS